MRTGKITRNIAVFIVIPQITTNKIENDKDEDTIKPNLFKFEDQKGFEKLITGHPLEVLLIATLYSGLRQGELYALTWNDVDFERKSVDINKTYR